MAGTAIYFKLRDKVIDGTPCNQETTDICVDGKCLVGKVCIRAKWLTRPVLISGFCSIKRQSVLLLALELAVNHRGISSI